MGLFKKKSEIKGPNWDVIYRAVGEDGKGPVVIEFDSDIKANRPENMDGCCLLVLTYKPEFLNADLTPIQEKVAYAEMIEEMIIKKIKMPCRLVSLITGEGKRELAFQSSDPKKLHLKLEKASRQFKTFSPRVVTSEGWNYYDQHVTLSPLEIQTIDDRRVVMAAVSVGAQLGEEVMTEHLITGEKSGLEKIASYLNTIEAAQNISVNDDGLTVHFKLPLVAPIISKTTMQLSSIADQSNCVYDGWGTLIQK